MWWFSFFSLAVSLVVISCQPAQVHINETGAVTPNLLIPEEAANAAVALLGNSDS